MPTKATNDQNQTDSRKKRTPATPAKRVIEFGNNTGVQTPSLTVEPKSTESLYTGDSEGRVESDSQNSSPSTSPHNRKDLTLDPKLLEQWLADAITNSSSGSLSPRDTGLNSEGSDVDSDNAFRKHKSTTHEREDLNLDPQWLARSSPNNSSGSLSPSDTDSNSECNDVDSDNASHKRESTWLDKLKEPLFELPQNNYFSTFAHQIGPVSQNQNTIIPAVTRLIELRKHYCVKPQKQISLSDQFTNADTLEVSAQLAIIFRNLKDSSFFYHVDSKGSYIHEKIHSITTEKDSNKITIKTETNPSIFVDFEPELDGLILTNPQKYLPQIRALLGSYQLNCPSKATKSDQSSIRLNLAFNTAPVNLDIAHQIERNIPKTETAQRSWIRNILDNITKKIINIDKKTTPNYALNILCSLLDAQRAISEKTLCWKEDQDSALKAVGQVRDEFVEQCNLTPYYSIFKMMSELNDYYIAHKGSTSDQVKMANNLMSAAIKYVKASDQDRNPFAIMQFLRKQLREIKDEKSILRDRYLAESLKALRQENYQFIEDIFNGRPARDIGCLNALLEYEKIDNHAQAFDYLITLLGYERIHFILKLISKYQHSLITTEPLQPNSTMDAIASVFLKHTTPEAIQQFKAGLKPGFKLHEVVNPNTSPKKALEELTEIEDKVSLLSLTQRLPTIIQCYFTEEKKFSEIIQPNEKAVLEKLDVERLQLLEHYIVKLVTAYSNDADDEKATKKLLDIGSYFTNIPSAAQLNRINEQAIRETQPEHLPIADNYTPGSRIAQSVNKMMLDRLMLKCIDSASPLTVAHSLLSQDNYKSLIQRYPDFKKEIINILQNSLVFEHIAKLIEKIKCYHGLTDRLSEYNQTIRDRAYDAMAVFYSLLQGMQWKIDVDGEMVKTPSAEYCDNSEHYDTFSQGLFLMLRFDMAPECLGGLIDKINILTQNKSTLYSNFLSKLKDSDPSELNAAAGELVEKYINYLLETENHTAISPALKNNYILNIGENFYGCKNQVFDCITKYVQKNSRSDSNNNPVFDDQKYIALVNSSWWRTYFAVEPSYLEALKKVYGSTSQKDKCALIIQAVTQAPPIDLEKLALDAELARKFVYFVPQESLDKLRQAVGDYKYGNSAPFVKASLDAFVHMVNFYARLAQTSKLELFSPEEEKYTNFLKKTKAYYTHLTNFNESITLDAASQSIQHIKNGICLSSEPSNIAKAKRALESLLSLKDANNSTVIDNEVSVWVEKLELYLREVVGHYFKQNSNTPTSPVHSLPFVDVFTSLVRPEVVGHYFKQNSTTPTSPVHSLSFVDVLTSLVRPEVKQVNDFSPHVISFINKHKDLIDIIPNRTIKERLKAISTAPSPDGTLQLFSDLSNNRLTQAYSEFASQLEDLAAKISKNKELEDVNEIINILSVLDDAKRIYLLTWLPLSPSEHGNNNHEKRNLIKTLDNFVGDEAIQTLPIIHSILTSIKHAIESNQPYNQISAIIDRTHIECPTLLYWAVVFWFGSSEQIQSAQLNFLRVLNDQKDEGKIKNLLNDYNTAVSNFNKNKHYPALPLQERYYNASNQPEYWRQAVSFLQANAALYGQTSQLIFPSFATEEQDQQMALCRLNTPHIDKLTDCLHRGAHKEWKFDNFSYNDLKLSDSKTWALFEQKITGLLAGFFPESREMLFKELSVSIGYYKKGVISAIRDSFKETDDPASCNDALIQLVFDNRLSLIAREKLGCKLETLDTEIDGFVEDFNSYIQYFATLSHYDKNNQDFDSQKQRLIFMHIFLLRVATEQQSLKIHEHICVLFQRYLTLSADYEANVDLIEQLKPILRLFGNDVINSHITAVENNIRKNPYGFSSKEKDGISKNSFYHLEALVILFPLNKEANVIDSLCAVDLNYGSIDSKQTYLFNAIGTVSNAEYTPDNMLQLSRLHYIRNILSAKKQCDTPSTKAQLPGLLWNISSSKDVFDALVGVVLNVQVRDYQLKPLSRFPAKFKLAQAQRDFLTEIIKKQKVTYPGAGKLLAKVKAVISLSSSISQDCQSINVSNEFNLIIDLHAEYKKNTSINDSVVTVLDTILFKNDHVRDNKLEIKLITENKEAAKTYIVSRIPLMLQDERCKDISPQQLKNILAVFSRVDIKHDDCPVLYAQMAAQCASWVRNYANNSSLDVREESFFLGFIAKYFKIGDDDSFFLRTCFMKYIETNLSCNIKDAVQVFDVLKAVMDNASMLEKSKAISLFISFCDKAPQNIYDGSTGADNQYAKLLQLSFPAVEIAENKDFKPENFQIRLCQEYLQDHLGRSKVDNFNPTKVNPAIVQQLDYALQVVAKFAPTSINLVYLKALATRSQLVLLCLSINNVCRDIEGKTCNTEESAACTAQTSNNNQFAAPLSQAQRLAIHSTVRSTKQQPIVTSRSEGTNVLCSMDGDLFTENVNLCCRPAVTQSASMSDVSKYLHVGNRR